MPSNVPKVMLNLVRNVRVSDALEMSVWETHEVLGPFYGPALEVTWMESVSRSNCYTIY